MTTTSYITGENFLKTLTNSTVGNYSYGWDANDNKTTETISGAMSGCGFNSTTYDDQDRLTAWTRADSALNQSWNLSAVGDWNTFTVNGTAQSRTHGPAHEITVVGGTSVTHDVKGNLTADKENIQYTWDFDNMLASCIVPSGSTLGTVGTHTYKYDALGRRVSKTVASTTTVFVHRDQQVMAEYTSGTAASSPLREYAWGTYVDELLSLIDRTAQGSSGAGVDERFYGHQSHQYHTIALTDASGAVFERYAYTPYGDLTILAPNGTTTRTTSDIGNVVTYTGQRYDAESTLCYFRARMMHSLLGRFTGRDPFEYLDGTSLYCEYFLPNGTDSTGLSAKCDKIHNACWRSCWKAPPPWPCSYHKQCHYAYCEVTCQAVYMACMAAEGAQYVFATACDAASWLAAHPEVAVGTIVLIGGVAYVVSTGGAGTLIIIPAAL